MLAIDRLTLAALRAGIAVPFLYYGVQVIAAPFFPDFSFVRVTASELGSDLSPYAAIFNGGIMLLGMVSCFAALGFFLGLRRLGTHWLLAVLTALALTLNGVQSIWAAVFPLPDPRHGGHTVFIVGMLAIPFLLSIVTWRRGGWLLRAYFLGTLVLLALMFPIMSGLTGWDLHAYRGLTQRIFTLTLFPPIGVAAHVLARRFKEHVQRLPMHAA